ncbi:mannosyltransferase family protein [Streptomyces cyaneofuscatus]|uniref:Mannosyltransferase family protein n=1 Tax=Streptomyces cyaneofuscatus TaxID=66883 RepID=A0ABZ1EYV1_9ACTN|nr:mannosyltransferase family protein [Streptomyces cyaneofuscatus]WSB09340.1 mannosyltransferase family protein [Streptomyces cyaneofuscatus]WSD47124.1 mannosyltransferase family protein [Streptomyces cyaneofuscatus]
MSTLPPGVRLAPPRPRSPELWPVAVKFRSAEKPVRHGSGPASRALRAAGFDRAAAWLSPADRRVLWLYLLTRISLWITAHGARWLFPRGSDVREAGPVLAPFQQWDANHYLHIARDGYFQADTGPWTDSWDNREAFFPGFPMLLRAVHLIVPSWTAAGLLISLVAGAVAVLALSRIARAYLPEDTDGHRTVLFFLLSPCAVFLAVGYTEALFLAFALPAWLAAQRHRWALACTLTALATTVRVSGLFLTAAIAVLFVLSVRTRRDWRGVAWLALPALPPLAYSWYLHAHTGDWMAWKHAQERGWYREFHTPWEAWSNTWNAAFDGVHTTGYAAMFQAELVAMVVGLALVALLARHRRWPEAVYVALSLWALGTSYWYVSIPRATLLWWPLWMGLAAVSLRRPWFRTAYLCVAVPVSALVALAFLTGRWAG